MPKYSDVEKLEKLNVPQDIADRPNFGIYAYVSNSGEVLYIGKDKAIDVHKRYNDHISPSVKNDQGVNKYIQTDGVANTVKYMVMCLCADEIEMCNIETMYIMFYKALGQCRLNKAIDIAPELFDKIVENISKIDIIFN